MRYTIYKITNTLNGKIYIGKHQTNNPNDSYYGSGKGIKSAIQLHGKENFIKEVLFDFDNENDMNEKEKEILTEDFISRTDNYNAAVGGEGGPHFAGRTHNIDSKKKISSNHRNRHTPVSEETRQKISEANRRRSPPSEETRRKISDKAKQRYAAPETREKISDTLKKKYNSGELSVNVYERTDEIKQKISQSMKARNKN